jgi:hypothetical protein
MENTQNLPAVNAIPEESAFSLQGFEHAQRISKMLADSTIVPEVYRGKVSNCIIALEMANRIGVSPLMVMQNMHIIKGKPGWSSAFIIASLNTCGRFTDLDFRQVGEKGSDSYGYEAFANSKKTGKELVSPVVDWAMVKGEGWLSKDGSKWRTMPELMFRYRAAAFFGRLHAPDILMGMHAAEEIMDVEATVIQPEASRADKESERIALLIKDARNLNDLQNIRDNVKPEQMELFNERLRDLS